MRKKLEEYKDLPYRSEEYNENDQHTNSNIEIQWYPNKNTKSIIHSHKKSNLYENANDQELQSNPEQREFYRIYHCTWLQVILLSYSNTNSMGLAYRSV